MLEQNDDKNEVSYLKAKLFEKERIEAFLRAEVKELWAVIHTLERFPLYKFYVKLAKIYPRILNRKKKIIYFLKFSHFAFFSQIFQKLVISLTN